MFNQYKKHSRISDKKIVDDIEKFACDIEKIEIDESIFRKNTKPF